MIDVTCGSRELEAKNNGWLGFVETRACLTSSHVFSLLLFSVYIISFLLIDFLFFSAFFSGVILLLLLFVAYLPVSFSLVSSCFIVVMIGRVFSMLDRGCVLQAFLGLFSHGQGWKGLVWAGLGLNRFRSGMGMMAFLSLWGPGFGFSFWFWTYGWDLPFSFFRDVRVYWDSSLLIMTAIWFTKKTKKAGS